MINDVIEIFHENNMRPFVYILNNQMLEELLLKKNFKIYDTQHVLKKSALPNNKNFPVHHIEKKDSFLWAEIFCKSYDCYDWVDEVNRIVRDSFSQVEYFIDEEHNASCVALFEKNSILGLYCLGTIPEKRKKGLAR